MIILLATIFAIVGGIYIFVGSILSQPANVSALVLRPQPPNKSYDAEPVKGIKKQSLSIPTTDGSIIHAWLFEVPNSRRLTIVNHGNAGNVSNRFYIADVLANAGSSSLVYDYRGYGKSTGVPTITGILEDGLTVYDYVREKMHYAADKIIVYGESIGSAVTCNIASKRLVEAVILQSGIASLPSAAKHLFVVLNLYPDFVFPEPHLDNVKLVETLKVPILILHGKKDHTVAFENADTLYARANEPKKLVFLDDCGHNDMGVQNTGLFFGSIKDFIGELK